MNFVSEKILREHYQHPKTETTEPQFGNGDDKGRLDNIYGVLRLQSLNIKKTKTLLSIHRTHPSKVENCVIFHLFVLQKIWMNYKLFVIGVSEDLDEFKTLKYEFKTLKCVFVPTNYLRKRRKLSKHEVPIGTNSIFTIVVRRHREVKHSVVL